MKPKTNRKYYKQPSQTQNKQKLRGLGLVPPDSSKDEKVIRILLKTKYI